MNAKPKVDQTPLRKYVSRLSGGKGGGTTNFTCPHCKIHYTSSYTQVIKNLCGKMAWDGNKQIGTKTRGSVS